MARVFAAVTLGGLGTAYGALLGSFVIGLFVQVSTLWVSTELKNVGAFAILILILILETGMNGTVIGRNMQRHRHQEFIRFLNAIERRVPAGKVIHVILDNYAAHKHAKVRRWLTRHPRWIFHFTPTSCSWLNAVEGWFAQLERRSLYRGVFTSVRDLKQEIYRFIKVHNRELAKPFRWTKNAEKIIGAVERAKKVLPN